MAVNEVVLVFADLGLVPHSGPQLAGQVPGEAGQQHAFLWSSPSP